MRITNHMIYGNSMNNIWRNARHINNLGIQNETGKRIQRPSDDPLISARALRYRTILSEAEQFLRNLHQGMAWMDVSEAAFNSVLTGSPTHPSLMQRINTRMVEAAQTGTNTLEDQRAILEELRQYFDQMFGVDMNQTYLGRYVFSGFHTDQPPVLKANWPPERSFLITQTFERQDIERTIAFYRENATSMPINFPSVHIIKLPFTEVNFAQPTLVTDPPQPDVPIVGITGYATDGLEIEFRIRDFVSTETNAYNPPALGPEFSTNRVIYIHHIRDTGELIMSEGAANVITTIDVTYEKNNFRAGELNPIVYFESVEVTGGVVTDHSSTLNPPQSIQHEISPNAYITINSHARNILTANLFSDLRRLFDFADSLVVSDPRVIEDFYRGPPHLLAGDNLANRVQQFISDEYAMFSAAMHDRINNMLELIMRHAAQAQREHTDMGSRMARLEMIGIRLEEDEVAYTELLSDNEDADLVAVMQRIEAAEIAFNHALMAIARTTQLSLADFINR